jgi:hypothetical protein
MLELIFIILIIFGAGFAAGYNVRAAVSRRRRRSARRVARENGADMVTG